MGRVSEQTRETAAKKERENKWTNEMSKISCEYKIRLIY